MSIHVAILKKKYANMVLAGHKTIECRLTRSAMPPFSCIETGHRIFIKVSGGPFVATALAGSIDSRSKLTADDLIELEAKYDKEVCGGPDYWRSKRNAVFATLVYLNSVEPMDVGPPYRVQNMRAWYVLEDDTSPLLELKVTEGGLRHSWVYVPVSCVFFNMPLVSFAMPDGEVIETAMRGRHFRWRGWLRYFQTHDVRAGDRVRFVRIAPGRYRVSFTHET